MNRFIASVVVTGVAFLSLGGSPAATKESSKLAYENFRKLVGSWEGKSTKGWTAKTTYTSVAGGSAIMEQETGAHPTEMIVTMYHMDGEHLMLTHYCMAKNQPRMRATEISEDGKTVLFTFVDGTNMKSRDVPHMDKALFKFDGPDNFVTSWTFYQDGNERWMEEIANHRVVAPPTTQTSR